MNDNEIEDVAIQWVTISTQKLGVARTLTTVKGLAEYLLYQWPDDGGKQHLAARKACVAALLRNASPDKARKAFIKACEASDIHVFPDERVGGRSK